MLAKPSLGSTVRWRWTPLSATRGWDAVFAASAAATPRADAKTCWWPRRSNRNAAKLRSYLGKAYADAGDYARAAKELQLAKKLNPQRPDRVALFRPARPARQPDQ